MTTATAPFPPAPAADRPLRERCELCRATVFVRGSPRGWITIDADGTPHDRTCAGVRPVHRLDECPVCAAGRGDLIVSEERGGRFAAAVRCRKCCSWLWRLTRRELERHGGSRRVTTGEGTR